MEATYKNRNVKKKHNNNKAGSLPFRITEGSLEAKLPTIWTDEKQRWEESEKSREEERESVRRKKMQVREIIFKLADR